MTRLAGSAMVAYWEPKEGSDRASWEDGVSYDQQHGRFAVTDGASTGSRSREWAYHLANGFVGQPFRVSGDSSATRSEARHWLEKRRNHFDPEATGFTSWQAPKWVQQESKRRGAHATMLAGNIANGRLAAANYGDCCLFHLRPDGSVHSFPAGSTEDFGSTPDLLTSLPTTQDPHLEQMRVYVAPFGKSDALLVASDALAEWLVGATSDSEVLDLFLRVGHEGFHDLCVDLRAAGLMKNDDVTLLRVNGALL